MGMYRMGKRRWRHTNPGRASGFTLIELMIAGTLGTVLSLVLFQVLLQAQHMADSMIMQSLLNSQAREVFELLMDGGVRPGGTRTTLADRIPGFHGRASMTNADLSRQNDAGTATTFRLRLGPVGAAAIRTRETLPTFSITCTAPDQPVKSCEASGEIYTIDGYVDGFTATSLPPAAMNAGLPQTFDVTLSLIDPQQVPRDGVDPYFVQTEYSASYWTVLTLNRD